MNILDKITQYKRHKEVPVQQEKVPISTLEQSPFFERKTFSLKDSLLQKDRIGIIAEFKRKSPSKGWINENAQVEQVTQGYVKAGVAGISVLSDINFFGGHLDYVTRARECNDIPILRKDFMVSEYQVIEAKASGADVILLIAACLSKQEIKTLAHLAQSLGMNVLLEIHNEKELLKLTYDVDIVGVNNRNLKDFSVSINTSLELVDTIPNDFAKISESGISQPETINKLVQAGFNGFLIGEAFMKHKEPEQACLSFLQALKEMA